MKQPDTILKPMTVDLSHIIAAQNAIREVIQRTRLEKSGSLTKRCGSDIYLKYENEQRTGSFKIRGAYSKLQSLSPEERDRGVIACSAGNHAQGLALAASLLGVNSRVVMPEGAPIVKVSATREYGAEVILSGETFDDALLAARELEKREGYTFVHPYEDPFVIAGQGTIGLEIVEDLPDVDTLIIPVGGGGLISGIATAVKALRPGCRVFGIQSEGVPGMTRLFHKVGASPAATRPEKNIFHIPTIADGIAVKQPSPLMYQSFISRLVDDMITVTDEEIAMAITLLLERAKAVVEGSGAVGVAAAITGKIPLGEKTCIVLSGGNIDLNIMSRVIDKGLIGKGRIVELSAVIRDLPGSLSRLTSAIAATRGNILEVHHDRISSGLFLQETRIDFVIETAGPEHVALIRAAMEETGARLLS